MVQEYFVYHTVVVYFTYSESLTAYTETHTEQVVCMKRLTPA